VSAAGTRRWWPSAEGQWTQLKGKIHEHWAS
jgi:uncharacterized protein YjbJ (UPF0337 family)